MSTCALCPEETIHDSPLCVPHAQEFWKSPEGSRAITVGKAWQYPKDTSVVDTALADFVRRVKGER